MPASIGHETWHPSTRLGARLSALRYAENTVGGILNTRVAADAGPTERAPAKLLMCLGTLVTMTGIAAPNFTLIITENGTYEVTGNQPVPGAGSVDFEGLARAAGVQQVYTIETEADFDAKLDLHFTAPGPAVFIWRIERADEPVPKPAAPIRQRAHALRDALTG